MRLDGTKGTVLDLFSGLRGWSAPWKRNGWSVITVDSDPAFKADLVCDVRSLPNRWNVDVVLASPPCTCFTTMAMGKHWVAPGVPRTAAAKTGLSLVQKAVDIVEATKPLYWVIENPRAMLRKCGVVPGERQTVWYCRYGESRAKPTDLWGGFPETWNPRPECHNGNKDHIAAPRGSRTGTQGGVSSAQAAKIPKALSNEIRLAVEHELGI